MKKIYDTKAAQSLSAYVILKGSKHIATVLAHYGDSRVTVEVKDFYGDDESKWNQRGTASGYGYDKFTAALTGLSVAGIKFSNHCGDSYKKTKARTVEGSILNRVDENGKPVTFDGRLFREDMKPPKGYRFANYKSDHAWVYNPKTERREKVKVDGAISGYNNCYRQPGLDILKDYGFTVIKAL